MFLSDDEYNDIVFQLMNSGDPFELFLDLERKYIYENPAFHNNLNLHFAVTNFAQPLDKNEQKKFVAILDFIEKRKKIMETDRKLPVEGFDINNLFFYDRHTEPILPEGKILAPLCCKPTIEIFEGLRKFNPSKDEYDVFIHGLRNHPFSREFKQSGNESYTLDLIFEQAELLQPKLREYYLDSMRTDMVRMFETATPLKLKFQKMFDERRKEHFPLPEPKADMDATQPVNRDFTTARQVLAMHYIFEFLQVRGVDQADKARFIEFLTGKNYKNIYDMVRKPLSTSTGNFRREDLQFIRPFFENLGLTEISKMIGNELDTRDE